MKKMIKRDNALLYHQRIFGKMIVNISYKTTNWYKELSLCEIGHQIVIKMTKEYKLMCIGKARPNNHGVLSCWMLRFFDGV